MNNCRKCKKEMPDTPFCPYCGTKQEITRAAHKRGNGQGCVYKEKNGKYRAIVTIGTYYDKDGKQRQKRVTKMFAKKSDAIAALPTLANFEHPTDMSLHDLYELYTSSREYDALSHSQQQKLGIAWKRWSQYEFRGIATLTVDDIQSLIEAKTSTHYPARDMQVLLSHLYRLAMRKEIVTVNKANMAEIPEQPKAKRECWTDEEVEAIWKDYAEHPFTAYPLIMCYAGLRYGEINKIALTDIHLSESYMIGGIKTEAGIDREIPIHKRIKPLIESAMQGRKKKLLEMGEDQFYNAYWAMVDRTGIRKLPPHTCRHYFFSKLTTGGVQHGLIAEIGGHANYVTTLKNYVRVPLSDKIDAVNQIK